MNKYEIAGEAYYAKSDYEAVKEAYKMADSIVFKGYTGHETWQYEAVFKSGKESVTVTRKVSDDWGMTAQ